ncbi:MULTISPECIES: hypothetical protein [Pseudomonas]|uniref:hypothetical protein n=1 Tax=Pseudomonas TaxID=286 RepID=UPI001E5D6D45|nr:MULTISPECIES: hypothetical protein [Pseudomonas]MCE1114218.1 hypothetical protein [Pseudomonas sp. NMI795_08]
MQYEKPAFMAGFFVFVAGGIPFSISPKSKKPIPEQSGIGFFMGVVAISLCQA